jgi:hypothetical protein
MTTDTNLIAEREQFLFKSFEQLKLNDYLNEKDDSCLMINSLRFSCSTPIKLNLKQNEQEDNNHNILLDQSMINNETEKKTALEIVNTDYLFEKCDLARLNELNETTFKQLQQQNSLIEFEQNEKLAQQNASNIYNVSSPVMQLESLLSNLRINSNNNTSNNPSKIINKDDLNNKEKLNNNSSFSNELPNSKVIQQQTHNGVNSVISTSQTVSNQAFFRKNDHLIALENRLEHEIFRRQHCEKQIHELNENLLELQQQLAVANGLDRKKEAIIQNMEISVQKVNS